MSVITHFPKQPLPVSLSDLGRIGVSGAIVLDAFSRKIVGLAIGNPLGSASLTEEVLAWLIAR